jgi:adenine-specific DNA-methyltransferase
VAAFSGSFSLFYGVNFGILLFFSLEPLRRCATLRPFLDFLIMASPFQQLRSKLSELFQLEAAAELDFGIYRILNSRRAEIVYFLDGLEDEVSRVLDANPDPKTAALRDELKKVEAGLRLGGFEEEMIQSAPKVKELRAELTTAAPTDPALLQHELFSHLTTFFSRYYKDGDFLSLRRYKGDTYAIPYQGEEVKLHWANADQYYIKSAENFRDYTFMLGSREDGVASPRVSFKLIQADTERDNTKAVAGQERRFIYHSVVSRTEDHLVLGFEYRPLTEAESGGPDTEGEEAETTSKKKKKKVTQATLNQAAVAATLQESARGPFTGLAAPMPTEKNKTRTLLEKRLSDYTARNTFDYFIHKDLGGFLRRELDFYLKNEVLHLDDLEKAGQDTWDSARQKMLALRAIAHRIIRFLAQIEDFQRKLWLKKKFVVGCDYVLTLDRIPEALYPEIAACEAQREEWVRLFGIDEITAEEGKVGYSVPLTVAFLKENQGLTVDTRLLPESIRQPSGFMFLTADPKMHSSRV